MNKKIVLALVSSLLIIVVILAAFLLMNMSNSSTTVYVDPGIVYGSVGQNFTINISISNIANLYGWECRLGWNAAVLDLINVTEGSFLERTGSTFFDYSPNETLGNLVIDCTLLGNVTGANGNGVLASIQFYVKNEGACTLPLFDTKFVDFSEKLIAHTVNSGQFSGH